jgi:hypothetical protein
VALLSRWSPDQINEEKVLKSSIAVPTERLGEVAPKVRASGPA